MKAQEAQEKAVITEYVQIYLGNKYDFYSTFFQKEFVSIKSTTQNSAARRKTNKQQRKSHPQGQRTQTTEAKLRLICSLEMVWS